MKKNIKFEDVKDGEWVQSVMKGYLMRCCDCGLIHKLDFKILEDINGNYIKFRAFRHNKLKTKIKKK